MGDLVLIRRLLRNSSAQANRNRDLSPFRQPGFEVLSGFKITRTDYPCDVLEIALIVRSIGLKSIKSCADVASDFGSFRKLYQTRMTKLLLIDSSDSEFNPIREAYERLFNAPNAPIATI